MERHIQADNAFIKWMEAMSKNVVHIADAWHAAVKWADRHPDISMVSALAYEAGRNDAIKEACEWLEQQGHMLNAAKVIEWLKTNVRNCND